jgi:hypothetical protein
MNSVCAVELNVTINYIKELLHNNVLWQIYVAGNIETHAGLHVKGPMLHCIRSLMAVFRRKIWLNRL